jgi:protein transport protein SEC13
MFPAHAIGANCVSWAPATAPGSLTTAGLPGQVGAQGQGLQHWKKFATGGCDGVIRIWSYAE